MEKQRWKESEKRRAEEKREDQRRERVRRKKMQVPEKVGKSRNIMFFQWFVAPEGRKVGLLKRRCGAMLSDERWKVARRCGAKHISKSKCAKPFSLGALLEVEMSKKCTLLCIWKSKCTKHQGWTTFGSWDVEKVHAVVARSTFPSQNVQRTPASEHFWKLRCRKSARCCAFGSQNVQNTRVGALLEVEMSKKCTPLWREDAGSTFPSQNVKTTTCSMLGPVLKVQMCFCVAGAQIVSSAQLCTQFSVFEGRLADLFRFWFCQLRKMRKSRRIASFLMLSSSKIEDVSQNCCAFDVVQLKKLRKSGRIASFSSFQKDR